MVVFTCEDNFEAMMTCIYDAWSSRQGHSNIRLELEPIEQTELFAQYIHVDEDTYKAEKVIHSIRSKISWLAYRQVYLTAMSNRRERLDAIYRFLVLGFAVGDRITAMLTEPSVMTVLELSRKVSNEQHFFREFTRFISYDQKIYISHIEPKSNVLALVAEHFADRMPSEHWIMLDDNRRLAVVHPKNSDFYVTKLSEEEWHNINAIEGEDIYVDIWREFFQTIGIESRKNPKCQRNMMPLWYRKHMPEFMNK